MGSGTKWLRPLVSHLKRPLRVCSGETEGGWRLAQGSWVGGVSRPAGQCLHCRIRQSFVLSVISSSHDAHSTRILMLWERENDGEGRQRFHSLYDHF